MERYRVWAEMQYMEMRYEWVTVNGNDKVYRKSIGLSGKGGVENWFIRREVQGPEKDRMLKGSLVCI